MSIPVWDQSHISELFPNLQAFFIELFTSVCTSNKGDSTTDFHVALVP